MKFNGPMMQNAKVIIAPNAPKGKENTKSAFEDALSTGNSDDQNILLKSADKSPKANQMRFSTNPVKSQTKFYQENQPMLQFNQNLQPESKQIHQNLENSQYSSENEGAVGPSQGEGFNGQEDVGIIQNSDKSINENQQTQYEAVGEITSKHFTPKQDEMTANAQTFNEASSLEPNNKNINEQTQNNGQNEISSGLRKMMNNL